MLSFNDLPPALQQQIEGEANGKLKKGMRERASQNVTREELLRCASDVLLTMKGLSLPQQRKVLKFTIEVLERANKLWHEPHITADG